MKVRNKKKIIDFGVVLSAIAMGVTLSACSAFPGASGVKACSNGQCVTVAPVSSGASSPAPASTYPTPTPQSESPSASIPGTTPSYTPSPTFTPTSPPPTPTEAVATSSPIPQEQFDSSLHRCKQTSSVNTLLSFSVDNQLFTCMQIPPDQMDLLIKLLVVAVYDALTHQQFPPAQYQGTVPAQQAQAVVTAYQGQS